VNAVLMNAWILRTTVSLRPLPSLAAFVPDGTVQQWVGARRSHVPQRPGPLPDGALILLLAATNSVRVR